MYKRSKKDDYCKRIEEMIGGSQKCSRGSFANSSNIDNYNTNISNDSTSVIDCSINDSNDDVDNITSSDINDSSSGINDNAKNDEFDINKIRVQKWNSVSTKVEGIRKYLEANKINLNNLITKLL
jgi:hypothetical protein